MNDWIGGATHQQLTWKFIEACKLIEEYLEATVNLTEKENE